VVINYVCDDPVNRTHFEQWASAWGARVSDRPRAVSLDHQCEAQVFDLDHLSPGEVEQILSELFRKPPRVPTVVHSYNLEDEQMRALRSNGVCVCRRLEPTVFRELCTSSRPKAA